MARNWFRADNTADLTGGDRAIINRAARILVDCHNMSPTVRNLSSVRVNYRAGLSAKDVVHLVNCERGFTQSQCAVPAE